VEEFDYLVLGGGSGGCVVAGRLSENPGMTVALVEAGGDGAGWVIKAPLGAAVMLPRKINNWALETVPQPGLGGRIGYQPRGKTLGGSSAVNAMVYIRGHRSDYDHWSSLGNPGWSYDDVLPYFKKAENNEAIADGFHGQGGPLNVANLRSDNPFQQKFLDAAREVQLPINADFNGAEQEGCGLYQVTQINGERCSAARAYIHPWIGNRRNLHVMTGARIDRLVIESGRVVGAQINVGGETRILRARHEVVLTAGAFGTPEILMRSGIGDGAALKPLGIDVVHHAPAVGRNLQDHPDFIFVYRSKSRDLLGLTLPGAAKLAGWIMQYRRERRGMIASNAAEGGAFLKTRRDLPAPDIQLHFVVAMIDDHARHQLFGHGFSCHVCLLRPASRGSVTLASADPSAASRIDPNFLGDPADVETMVAGFKMTRRLMDAPSLKSQRTQEMFTEGVETDDQIRDILRRRVDTVYHPVGTCAMGPDPSHAVVDPKLRVHGIAGLRIADASIMPTLVGGNTNAPTIMIGEKVADLIRAA
jgi:choline dehydrogenase-like flavoprotein